MKLTFQRVFLSINEFPPVELPAFTLLTGLNGSGKTHMLKAIAEGHISVDVAPNIPQIRYYDWTSLMPSDAHVSDGHKLAQDRATAIQQFEGVQAQYLRQLSNQARTLGVTGDSLSNMARLTTLTEADLVSLLGDSQTGRAAYPQIRKTIEQLSQGLVGHHGFRFGRYAQRIAQRMNKPALALTREDFEASDILPFSGDVDPFRQSLATMFVGYRDLWLRNRLAQFGQSKGEHHDALSDEEFVAKYGTPPWDFANQLFRSANLDMTINHPNLNDYSVYLPKLTKLSNQAQISFADLSSGEKVLASLALAVYAVRNDRQLLDFPKLLLFDEVDAPLHPGMVRYLLRVITETLVEEKQINVIATTHSPATVALAPKDAIHVMQIGRVGIRRTTKAAALNVLTVDVPTLAISYDGRRQVFVESEKDAILYDAMYQRLKPLLKSERSLEFVETGIRSATGSDRNTGCENVRRIVRDLVQAGNSSVFGLIDWDGKNCPDERIRVLAGDRRNGLENLILDPLLVAALIVRDARGEVSKIGLQETDSYIEFLGFSTDRLEAAAAAVQQHAGCFDSEQLIDVKYWGNFALRVSKDYLERDDHALEAAVLHAFPALKGFARRDGELMRHIVEKVMADKPQFIPMEVLDCFRDLLSMPSHKG